MLKASTAKVHLKTSVSQVEHAVDGKGYTLFLSDEKQIRCRAVVMASPLELNTVHLPSDLLQHHVPPNQRRGNTA